jgi:LysM repeat protein
VNRQRPPRRRVRRRRIQPGTLYAAGFIGLVFLAVAIQFVVHMARTEPRDARAIAERELQVNTLAAGEQVFRMVSVFRRPAIDYFRATRGLLVLTNRRMLYLGLQPRDLLASADLPPTFEEREFPIDTMVQLTPGRTLFGLAKAINVKTPNETFKLGVTSSSWPAASVLIIAMDARHQRAVAESKRQGYLRSQFETQRRAAEAARRKPRSVTVGRGDALGSIATRWNTTPDKLKQWNRLPDSRIRVGQQLIVKPAT